MSPEKNDDTLFLRSLVFYTKGLSKNETNATKKMAQNLQNANTICRKVQMSK